MTEHEELPEFELWEDLLIAARIRARMPEESTIDLDEHAERIARTVALAHLYPLLAAIPPPRDEDE